MVLSNKIKEHLRVAESKEVFFWGFKTEEKRIKCQRINYSILHSAWMQTHTHTHFILFESYAQKKLWTVQTSFYFKRLGCLSINGKICISIISEHTWNSFHSSGL